MFKELSIAKDAICKGTRIITPHSLQNKVIKITHEGHQGLVKTKQLPRSRVWLPKVDEKILLLLALALHVKLLPSGDYVLVIIDEHSRFPEIRINHFNIG